MQQVLTYTKDVQNSRYGYLEDFGDIFLPEYKNSKESIFAVQHSNYEDDNTRFGRANWSNMLNGCWGMWSCGWDFHKPSQNLVNAFKTKDGLPMFEDYNKETDYPVNGVPTPRSGIRACSTPWACPLPVQVRSGLHDDYGQFPQPQHLRILCFSEGSSAALQGRVL
jgi:SusD family.